MIEKEGVIVHREKGYFVESESGKNLGGPYGSHERAENRLDQVEMFKHMDKKNKRKKKKKRSELFYELIAIAQEQDPTTTYSSVIRELRKEGDPEKLHAFQRSFKEAFDKSFIDGLEMPEQVALMSVMEQEKKEAARIERFLKIAQLQPMPLGDAASAANHIIPVIRFLMDRVPSKQRNNFIEKLRQKIWNISELELSNKMVTSGSAIGQAITFVKNILMGHNPAYIREVLKHVATKL